jgi:phosphoglycolate phosphatase-like HAD superfamily hydrolase
MMDILALDFDGVICNSAGEACASGWKAAARLWPDRFREEVPEQIIESFIRVRPVMETGYESILLVRLLRDGCSVEKILADAPSLFSGLMQDAALSKEELVHLFGYTRDTWMAKDLPGWLDAHDFYDGAIDALNESHVTTYIITTKQKRFALALCDAAGLGVPGRRVFGLESGKKLKVLTKLARQHVHARIHFLEDRLSTLIATAHGADFDIRLYFSTWGYHTADERIRAEKAAQIRVLTQDQFPQFARMPSDFAI